MYVSLLVSLFGSIGVVQAAFAPADRAALKSAVGACTCMWVSYNSASQYLSCPCTGGCLGENPTGSCPIFAASNDDTGNPYGVIGNWDVSAVTNIYESKCTLSLFLWPRRLPFCGVFVEYIRQLEVRRITSLTRFVLLFVFVV